MTKQETFEWVEANNVANEIRSKLEHRCQKIMVAGSLRRQCETVHDIDIVLCPLADWFGGFVSFELRQLLGPNWQEIKGGAKLIYGTYSGIPVDLYFATPETWWTLVVIRTGSAASNIRLCQRAKSLGMKLHADGSGLEQLEDGVMFQPTAEEDLFRELQLDYVKPKDRR
jgi:DNA polymerase/3'-5' exonuclease PolX